MGTVQSPTLRNTLTLYELVVIRKQKTCTVVVKDSSLQSIPNGRLKGSHILLHSTSVSPLPSLEGMKDNVTVGRELIHIRWPELGRWDIVRPKI